MRPRLTDPAYSDILLFVEQYQDFLTKPFFDTGLEVEEQIRDGYIDDGDALGREIYTQIMTSLSGEIVPYENLLSDKRLSVTRLGSRLIFVHYIEKNSEREVVQVEIFHR